MIAFRDGHDPEDNNEDEPVLSKHNLKKLVHAILLANEKFTENSYHEGLSPSQLEIIISHLMYTEDYNSAVITINKGADGYHLGLKIHALN